MENEKVFAMSTGRVIPCLVAKAQRKGRTQQEVYAVIAWLLGYSPQQIDDCVANGVSYQEFFDAAPLLNPHWENIRGTVCGVRVQEVADPLMRKIRCQDKLVDDLAKGKDLAKVLSW